MQKKTTVLAMMLLMLISLTSFTPGPSGKVNLAPTACDLWVENHTAEDLTTIEFISNLATVTFSNILANGGTNGGMNGSVLQFDDQEPVTILITFNNPPPGAVARFYNWGSNNLVGTLNIVPGINRMRLYPPLASDVIKVIIDP